MSAVTVQDLNEYRARVERSHLTPPRPEGGLPPARRASELPDPPPVAWLIDQVWPAGEFGLIVGDGGAFKSSVAIHMACAVAGGHRLFDEFQCLPRPALIISAEDHRDIVLMRAKAFCVGHGWGKTTLDNLYLLAEGGPTLHDSQWAAHLADEILRIRPGLIVLDPWAELMGGDENSNTDARPAIKYIRHIAGTVGAAVVLVHHAGKMKEGGRSLDRIRGASALPSAARVVWFFDFTDDGLKVENLKHSRAPRLEPFQIAREIVTTPGNRAQWLSARVTRQVNHDPLADKVLMHLMQAPNGERSFNELSELLNCRRTTLKFTLDRLTSSRQIEVREGPRKSQIYSRTATGSHWFPDSGTSSPGADAPPAPARVGGGRTGSPRSPAPLKGAGGGNQSHAAGAWPSEPVGLASDQATEPLRNSAPIPTGSQNREPVAPPSADDILARLEERRGIGSDL